MILKRLQIFSDFKNLRGLTVNFKKEQDTFVLIGNNGSGKSSILEALSSIFNALYADGEPVFEFDFAIVYERDGSKVSITRKNGTTKIKAASETIDIATLRRDFLPSRLVCNYSGEDMRIRDNYYRRPFETYINRLRRSNGDNPLRMVFVDKDVWQIILLVMMSCRNRIESFAHFLDNTLGLPPLESLSVSFDEKQLAAWTENPVTYYVRQFIAQISTDGLSTIESVNAAEHEPFNLFNLWNSTRPLIQGMSIKFKGGIDAMMLSEGEKKMMVVLFILEAIADENSIVLLDEPDSHIHVARKEELRDYFEAAANRLCILTSHSPTLTAKFPDDSIIMLDRQEDGHSSVVKKEKKDIVARLTNNIWTLQEQNIFLASNKTVLVVEGKTDEQILDTALKSLQRAGRFEDLNFSYLPCGGASNVPNLVSKFTPKPGQKMITFFDADKAGWNAIKEVFGMEYNAETFGKARKHGDIWYTTYPPAKKIKNFNLEDYFPRNVFLRYVMRFKSLEDICTKKVLKESMAKDCLAGKMTDKQLEKFALAFERIEEIIAADNNGSNMI